MELKRTLRELLLLSIQRRVKVKGSVGVSHLSQVAKAVCNFMLCQ